MTIGKINGREKVIHHWQSDIGDCGMQMWSDMIFFPQKIQSYVKNIDVFVGIYFMLCVKHFAYN